MKILKIIGSVFVRIWRWIKNTAWVQPLLIVGIIFGVIFSIPAITSAIQGAINNANSSEKFLGNFKKSMEGGVNSDLDKLFNNYAKYAGYKTDAERESIPAEEKKYFLCFTKNGDNNIADTKGGFEILQQNWKKTYIPDDGKDFRLYTVFTDEVTKETESKISAFYKFMDRHGSFFEHASEVALNSQYYFNGKSNKADIEKIGEANSETFVTPTIILVDWSDNTKTTGPGVTQMMFQVSGSDNWARASLLLDCWNSKGDFKSKTN